MAAIKIDWQEEEAVIKEGASQRCSLFNLFIEYALKDIKEEYSAG